jgi:integration host factor subunit beta
MVKADLVTIVAEQKQIKTKKAQIVVDTLFDAMSEAIASGRGVEIRGFASFKIKRYQSYQGRNPRTGEPMQVAEKKGVVFKPGAELRRRVNGGNNQDSD